MTETEALAAIRQWRDDVDGGEPVFLDRLDAILALVQPAEGVVLSREDAALAARALRSIRGDRPDRLTRWLPPVRATCRHCGQPIHDDGRSQTGWRHDATRTVSCSGRRRTHPTDPLAVPTTTTPA